MCPRHTLSLAPLPCNRISPWALWLAIVVLCCGAAKAQPRHRRARHFRAQATAYSQSGTTASGSETHIGVVAADPAVLPLGTRIRVKGPGVSGTYVVTDTGRKIDGRHIDIYMRSRARANRFGKKLVEVTVLSWGEPEPG